MSCFIISKLLTLKYELKVINPDSNNFFNKFKFKKNHIIDIIKVVFKLNFEALKTKQIVHKLYMF